MFLYHQELHWELSLIFHHLEIYPQACPDENMALEGVPQPAEGTISYTHCASESQRVK
jgi:hypothetical protein